jgi:hypothetical protein
MWFFLALLVGGLIIASLAWDVISAWLGQNRQSMTDYGELVRKQLASGNYRVVAGVFRSNGTRLAQQTWDAATLDEETRARFSKRDTVRIEL